MIIVFTRSFPPTGQGGATVVVYNLALALARAGERVEVVTQFRRGSFVVKNTSTSCRIKMFDAELPFVVRRVRMPFTPLRGRMMVSAILQAASTSRSPPVVITGDPGYAKLFVSFTRRRLPLICIVPSVGSATGMEENVHTAASFIAPNSDYVASIITRNNRISDSKVKIIPPGVELMTQATDEACAEFARYRVAGSPVLVSVANLFHTKRIDTVIRALPLIRRAYPKIQYVVAGGKVRNAEGELARLQKIAGECGVSDLTHFVGCVDGARKTALLESADLFVLPASVEGFGIVFLEAALCELPAVGAQRSGAADAIIDGKTGFLCDGETPEAIASVVIYALGNKEILKQMGQTARSRALADFQWDGIAARYLALVEQARQQAIS